MSVANTGWLVGGRAVSDALSLVLFGIIAREYGPAGLGVYSTYFAVATILYDLITLGIADYGVREYARAPQGERQALVRRLIALQRLVALCGVVTTALFAAVLAIGWEQAVALLFLGAFQVSNALCNALLVPALAEGSLRERTIAVVGARVGIAAVALAAALVPGSSVNWALAGFPVFGVAMLLLIARAARREGLDTRGIGRRDLDFPLLRRLLPFFGADALASLVVRIPMLVLFSVAGAVPAGLYATAYKLAELGWQMLVYVPLAAYSALTRALHAADASIGAEADPVLRRTLVAGGVLAWGLYSVAPPLVVPLLGEKVAEAIPLVRVIAAFLVVHSIGTFMLRMMLALDAQAMRLRFLALQAVVTLLLCLLLAPRWGVTGTIIALVGAEALNTGLQYRYVRRHLADSGFLRRRVLSFLGAVGAATAATLLLERQGAPAWACGAASLAVLIGGYAATRLLRRDLLRSP